MKDNKETSTWVKYKVPLETKSPWAAEELLGVLEKPKPLMSKLENEEAHSMHRVTGRKHKI